MCILNLIVLVDIDDHCNIFCRAAYGEFDLITHLVHGFISFYCYDLIISYF